MSRAAQYLGFPMLAVGAWCAPWLAGADAADICVSCESPSAVYRCQVTGPAPATGSQLTCIKEIATRGGHATCSINTTQSAEPCNGLLVVLDTAQEAPAVPEPAAVGSRGATAPVIVPEPAPSAANPATKGPPATVEAAAKDVAAQTKTDLDKANAALKDTAHAAGREVQKAGNVVGTAAKKTWDCLSSLFFAC